MAKNVNNMLIPNVSKIPGQKQVDVSNKLGKGKGPSDFSKLLNNELTGLPQQHAQANGLKLSQHAAKRLNDRDLSFDANEYVKIKEGVDKLKEKGGKESLLITPNAAYIVDVPNNTIVTAIDKNRMSENVFTKIDSTIFMN